MYETLSYLPEILLNQTYESYIAQHIFNPLNMTASTFSVAEAEARGTLTDGFQRDMQDVTKGENGTLTAIVPHYERPGEERTLAGAGGILASARDLVRPFNGGNPMKFDVLISCSVTEGYLDLDADEQWPSPIYQCDYYTCRSCRARRLRTFHIPWQT